MEKLINIVRKNQYLSPEDKLKIVAQAIESKTKGIYARPDGRYVIQRGCQYDGYNIGHWVQTAKCGPVINKEFRAGLKKLNVYLGKLKESITVEDKLDIIKQAVEDKVDGIIFYEDGTIDIRSNCSYKGFNIGKSIDSIKHGNITNKNYLDGLRDMNIVTISSLTVSKKLYIIQDAIEKKIDGITFDDAGRVVFSDNCTHMDFDIGKAIQELKRGTYTNLYFKKGLTKLNVALDKEYLVLSDDQKLALINRAIKDNAPGVLRTRDGQIVFKTSCRYKDFPIGIWVEMALLKNGKKKFRNALIDLNITDDRDLVNAILKADKIQEAIDNNVEGIIKLPIIDRVYINSYAKYDSIEIGHIISNIMSNRCFNDELINRVKDMKIIVDKREREIARRLIEIMQDIEKGEGVEISPNGKIRISAINNHSGMLIKRVNEGSINNKMFIKGLLGLNIDLDPNVISNYKSNIEENNV